jgi:hypothetical protein
MARLTAATRDRLPTASFALPGRRYPINDASHARNALSRVSQYGTPRQKATVRAAVHRRYPGIGRSGVTTPRRLADQITTMRSNGAFGRRRA